MVMIPAAQLRPPEKANPQPVTVTPDAGNLSPGVAAEPSFAGQVMTGLVSHDATSATVRLANGQAAVIPADSPLFAAALALPAGA